MNSNGYPAKITSFTKFQKKIPSITSEQLEKTLLLRTGLKPRLVFHPPPPYPIPERLYFQRSAIYSSTYTTVPANGTSFRTLIGWVAKGPEIIMARIDYHKTKMLCREYALYSCFCSPWGWP